MAASQCKPFSKTRRTVMILGMERCCIPGAPDDAKEQIAVYDVFNPIQAQIETIPLNRAKDSLDREGVGIGVPSYRVTGKIFVYGSGVANRPPKWMELIRMSGWAMNRTSAVAPPDVVSPPVVATEADLGTGNIDDNATLFYVITTQASATANESAMSEVIPITIASGPSNVDFTALPAVGAGTGRIYRATTEGGPYYLVVEYTGVTTATDDVELCEEVNIEPPVGPPDVSNVVFDEINDGLGAIANGTYYYVVTIQPAGGTEGPPSAQLSFAVATGPSDVELDVLPDPGTGGTGRIYRGTVSGGPYLLAETYAGPSTGPVTDNNAAPAGSPPAAAINAAIFTPLSQDHDSGEIEVYLNSWKHDATNVRGNIDFTGAAGALFEGNFDMQGRYNDATATANPAAVASPGIPPRVCDINMTITPDGDSAITPVVKSVGFTPGAQPQERRDANQANCLLGYEIVGEFQGTLRAVIEVSTTHDYIKSMNDAEFFTVEFTIGTGTGRRVRFQTKTLGAQFYREPQYTDDNGIRTYDLEWGLTGLADDYATITHY